MYQSRFGYPASATPRTTVFVGGVVNDQVHDEAHPLRSWTLQEAVVKSDSVPNMGSML